MDKLGQRIIDDKARATELRERADRLEREARDCRRDAAEIIRLLEQAKWQR